LRKDEALSDYVPLLVFDIDHIKSDFDTSLYLADIKALDFVFCAFPSLSGHGIRVMIWTDSQQADQHKKYYKAIAERIAEALKINLGRKDDVPFIDLSTSNLSRAWYVSPVIDANEFYLNVESRVFTFDEIPTEKRPANDTINEDHNLTAQPTKQTLKGKTITISDDDKITICEQMTIQRNGTAATIGRNNFVFAFAALMHEHGTSKTAAYEYCLNYQDDSFTSAEIKKTLESAYGSTSRKFSDTQILKYINGKEPPPMENRPTPTATPEVFVPDVEPVKEKKQMSIKSEDEADPKLEKLLRYLEAFDIRLNVASNILEWTEKGGKDFEELNENDLLFALRKAGMKNIKDDLMTFIGSSQVKQYDPFLYYFDSLPKWQGDHDHILKLSNFVKAEEQSFFNEMFKKHLVRAVACALEPHTFNKHCLTLVGKQNDGKSTFVRFLCPPKLRPYFKDGIRFENKDADIALTENFIINLDELATFTKSDINRIKEVFSKETVKSRRPFAKRETTMTRRASFFASTNDDEFLTDVTGNVRWLVFKIDNINHDSGGKKGYQSIDINSVWSQAYTLYKQGYKYQLSKDELERSEEKNKSHMINTIEMELISQYYEMGTTEKFDMMFSSTEFLNDLQSRTTAKLNNVSFTKAKKFLKFFQLSTRLDGHNSPTKRYFLLTKK
jgi:predicted P-loop ATPase